jgi:hypothetical protein
LLHTGLFRAKSQGDGGLRCSSELASSFLWVSKTVGIYPTPFCFLRNKRGRERKRDRKRKREYAVEEIKIKKKGIISVV